MNAVKLSPHDIMHDPMQAGGKDYRLPRWLRIIVIGRNPKWTLIRIVILVTAVTVLRAYVLLPIRVKGPSMLPTYKEGGINFVNRLAYLHSEPSRGDVVAIRLAGTSIMYMKRIVGLPGETVEFRSGSIYVNGKILKEPYASECNWNSPPKPLPAGWYYVVGDNRSMPEAFHEEGKTSRNRIVGKILLCKSLFDSSSQQY
jgi:signal peptidase I